MTDAVSWPYAGAVPGLPRMSKPGPTRSAEAAMRGGAHTAASSDSGTRGRSRRAGVREGNRVLHGANAGRGPGQRSGENARPTDLRDEEDQAEADGADQGEHRDRDAAQAQQHAALRQAETAQRARQRLSDLGCHLYVNRPRLLRAKGA